ncbi:MAG: hypothetical protein NTV38_07620, partial [Chloroflexi bacterium]|nr:hypothetical protein [Chloroflexota bacterium]
MSCGSRLTSTPVVPTSTPVPTVQPSATPAPTLWVAPYIPAGLSQSIVLPEGWGHADTSDAATARLEIGDQNVVSRWVYVLVAPFPTIIDNVTSGDVKTAWQGNPFSSFGSFLLMDQNTRDVFTAWWGEPAASVVRVLP